MLQQERCSKAGWAGSKVRAKVAQTARLLCGSCVKSGVPTVMHVLAGGESSRMRDEDRGRDRGRSYDRMRDRSRDRR